MTKVVSTMTPEEEATFTHEMIEGLAIPHTQHPDCRCVGCIEQLRQWWVAYKAWARGDAVFPREVKRDAVALEATAS